jgi:Skp family chaperone for outer membrane proteins
MFLKNFNIRKFCIFICIFCLFFSSYSIYKNDSLFASNEQKAQLKFCIVSMQKISESSNAFQSIKKQMEMQANSMRVKFENKAKEIRKKEAEIEKKSKVAKPEAIKDEVDNLKKESQKMNDDLNSERQNLEKVYFETMKDFQDKVNKIISDYAKKNNIDGILESSNMIYFGNNILNITDEILNLINKEIKDFNIKF